MGRFLQRRKPGERDRAKTTVASTGARMLPPGLSSGRFVALCARDAVASKGAASRPRTNCARDVTHTELGGGI